MSRSRVRRAHGQAFQDSASFRLKGGELYRFDFDQAAGELWAYTVNLMIRVRKYGQPDQEPPEIVQRLRQAEDPYAAIQPFLPPNRERALADPLIVLEYPPETSEEAESVPDLSDK